MPEWCPKCHGMLSPGAEVCPVCGTKLSRPTSNDWTSKEMWEFVFTILKFALVPLAVGILLAFICVISTNH